MKFIILYLLVAAATCSSLSPEQLANQIVNSMKYDLEGTSSSFTKLLNGNGMSAGNSSVKVSVGLLAHVVIRVESQGHIVNQTVALLGGLHQNINQQNHFKLHENLAQSRKQVETHANELGPNETGIFIGSLFSGNQTVSSADQTIAWGDRSNFTGGFWLGIRTNVTQSKFN